MCSSPLDNRYLARDRRASAVCRLACLTRLDSHPLYRVYSLYVGMAFSYRPPGGAGAGYGAYPNYHNPTPPPPGGHSAYYPPPAAQQHQHQPHYQPSPIHAPPSDPFRNFYASRLRELTFNSRQIIQDLSVTAMQQRDQGNWPNMQAIVEEIEAAVLRVRPDHLTLPVLH